jgi:AraC-like DNA-binding protein
MAAGMGAGSAARPGGAARSARRGGRRAYSPYKLCALLDAGEEFGLPAERLLRNTGLSRAMLDDPQTQTSIDQYLIACRNALDSCDDPELPFRVGAGLHLSAYGPYGFALLCSPTVRDAFTLAVRYHSLATPIFPITWHETPESFVWTFPEPARLSLEPRLRRFLLAQQLAQHVTHVKDIARADRRPHHVTVRHEAPHDEGVYGRYLQCPVSFDADATEILYDPSVLDDRPPLTNRVTLARLRDACEQLIGSNGPNDTVVGDVRSALMEQSGRFPSMEQVAMDLGLTTRTLRRRLAEEGRTFSSILDEVRRDLAVSYLAQRDFSIADIASLLGFDDATNFRRAFRRWTGRTPSSVRITTSA